MRRAKKGFSNDQQIRGILTAVAGILTSWSAMMLAMGEEKPHTRPARSRHSRSARK